MPVFGTLYDPAQFVEIEDPAVPGQPKRPPAGTTLKVRSYPDSSPLADITVGNLGYWSAIYDAPQIQVSADPPGTPDLDRTWVGPLQSVEATQAAINAGALAQQALDAATAAAALAASAAAGAGASPATPSARGTVKLAGDLQGTADAPTVRGLTGKTDTVMTINAPPDNPGALGEYRITYATSGASPTMYDVWYDGGGIPLSLASFWLNENGAPRCSAPKAADSALKVVGYGPSQTVPTLLVEQRNLDGAGGRQAQWGINKSGAPIIGKDMIVGAHVVVIASTDTVPPANTPAGTVVIKKRT